MDLQKMQIWTPGLFNPITSPEGQFLYRFDFYIDGKICQCPSSLLSDFLFAEYQLRAVTQIKHYYKKDTVWRARAPGNSPYNAGFYFRENYAPLETNFYLKEFTLPDNINSLRELASRDPGWYLNGHLTHYCARSGGCCGKGCDCCKMRLGKLTRAGLSGHCTWACLCCRKRKEISDYFPEEKEIRLVEDGYKAALQSVSPVFLRRLADAYFKEPEPSTDTPQNPETEYINEADSKAQKLDLNSDENFEITATTKPTCKPEYSAVNDMPDSRPPSYKEIAKSDNDGDTKAGRFWGRKKR